MPIAIPRINEMANPIIPLKIVKLIIRKKLFDVINLIVATKVDSGDGRISSDL